ncbi:TonB-dependent receptor [Tamlana sp. 62-3]|uniref:TonB-dependent receptor n=1 Tax=Neotamlana sargassicola TaxID=2883125 RepID=A0A9X1I730_9FLAO|nr:TonB-dependent receptor [Tamlana sargassicola]MCB4807564.1 TonB-dependent receptor [Tamlana sargassicola]
MSLNKNKIIIYFLAFVSYFGIAQNENTTVIDSVPEALEEVMVTATRTVRQLSSLPLPAQIVSKADIIQSNSIRLNDILNEQTGLITVPDFGGGEGIQLQGLDSQYTLILVDGVPLIGRSAGTLDISRLTVGNIKQIEIVKGASSSLYGSNALGGVINIITENPKPGFKTDLNYRLGAFNTNDLNTSINYSKKKLATSFFANRYSSSGYDFDETDALNTVEPFVNYTLNGKVNYQFNDKTSLTTSGRYYYQNQDYVASETIAGESKINEWNTHVKLNHDYNNKWSSYFKFYASRYKAEEYLNNNDGSLYSNSYYNHFLVRPEIRANFKPTAKTTFTGGLGFSHETLDRTYFTSTPIFNSPYVYLQYDGYLNENLNVILGARFDSHNKYKSQFSPKAALRYKINTKLAVKGSVGYGYKAPDFRQLYFDFINSTVGYTVLGYNTVTTKIPELEEQGEIENIIVPISNYNDALYPESSVSINFGVDYKIASSLKLSVNIFSNLIEDLIDTQVIATKTNGQNVFSYYNVNQVYTQGAEFNAHWKPNNNLKISGGYQLLYAKDKEAENAFKNDEVFARNESGSSFQLQESDYFGLYNQSRHMANFKVFYNIPKINLDANLRATYRSKYALYDTNDNLYLDDYDDFVSGYSVIDVAVNKTFYKNYTVGIGADNLFDFTDTQNITNIPGRILYGKINIKF